MAEKPRLMGEDEIRALLSRTRVAHDKHEQELTGVWATWNKAESLLRRFTPNVYGALGRAGRSLVLAGYTLALEEVLGERNPAHTVFKETVDDIVNTYTTLPDTKRPLPATFEASLAEQGPGGPRFY